MKTHFTFRGLHLKVTFSDNLPDFALPTAVELVIGKGFIAMNQYIHPNYLTFLILVIG